MELKNLAWERSLISLFRVNPVGPIIAGMNRDPEKEPLLKKLDREGVRGPQSQ